MFSKVVHLKYLLEQSPYHSFEQRKYESILKNDYDKTNSSMFNDIIEKFAACNELHYHKNICRCAYHLIPELYRINRRTNRSPYTALYQPVFRNKVFFVPTVKK